jgi:hypothetical protein
MPERHRHFPTRASHIGVRARARDGDNGQNRRHLSKPRAAGFAAVARLSARLLENEASEAAAVGNGAALEPSADRASVRSS